MVKYLYPLHRLYRCFGETVRVPALAVSFILLMYYTTLRNVCIYSKLLERLIPPLFYWHILRG